ncbi:DNA alkylation repair protein [Vibrio tubiashii]|uniref:DNA alkylation repair protein n=1 Tax=Vibrio tubiashii TaxID=29498 RepID=A0AAE5LGN0_9VIBR|nr:DNA alkylation repair protein [Vibrio tubiashii]NOI79588.1 DNA alkylation repair protein [Vibrio tubiashii]
MHPWNASVKTALEPLANHDNALQMKSYMRGQFQFYGIQSTQRREALKSLFAKQQLPSDKELPVIVKELWQLPEREFQMIAVDLLIKRKKLLPATFLTELEWLITSKSWWDTVDMLATHIAAALFSHHPKETLEYLERWRHSDNIWLRRTAILYQLKFKQQTDEKRLFETIKENQTDNEFFIQKAIGWALREYSKTNATAVVEFIEQQGISGLAKREGLKWLSNRKASPTFK